MVASDAKQCHDSTDCEDDEPDQAEIRDDVLHHQTNADEHDCCTHIKL